MVHFSGWRRDKKSETPHSDKKSNSPQKWWHRLSLARSDDSKSQGRKGASLTAELQRNEQDPFSDPPAEGLRRVSTESLQELEEYIQTNGLRARSGEVRRTIVGSDTHLPRRLMPTDSNVRGGHPSDLYNSSYRQSRPNLPHHPGPFPANNSAPALMQEDIDYYEEAFAPRLQIPYKVLPLTEQELAALAGSFAPPARNFAPPRNTQPQRWVYA